MAPLSLEIYVSENRWIKVGIVNPGDPFGSISNTKSDGSRDIYIFECLPDNSKSIIYRSKAGIDTEIGELRLLTTKGAEVVKELTRGDNPHEMKIKTDKSSQSRLTRFTHI